MFDAKKKAKSPKSAERRRSDVTQPLNTSSRSTSRRSSAATKSMREIELEKELKLALELLQNSLSIGEPRKAKKVKITEKKKPETESDESSDSSNSEEESESSSSDEEERERKQKRTQKRKSTREHKTKERSEKESKRHSRKEKPRRNRSRSDSRSRASEQVRRAINDFKLQFKGETEDAELFLEQATDCYESCDAPDKVWIKSIVRVFKGKAYSWYSTVKKDIETWDDLVRAFEKRYLGALDDEEICDDLRRKLQARNEPIADYVDTFRHNIGKMRDPPSEADQIKMIHKN